MRHLGDIKNIDGAKIPPVDIITGGSPCQDLSVAGRREGLAGERSGLFLEQIRVIKEMRDATAANEGFPYVFEQCGAKAVWASEVDEFCIAVTKRRFPEEDEDGTNTR